MEIATDVKAIEIEIEKEVSVSDRKVTIIISISTRNIIMDSTEEWLSRVQELVPIALTKAKKVHVFTVKWKIIISKIKQIPPRLSDLSTHPCFSKNALCKEQLQAISKTLDETIDLANTCIEDRYEGKLLTQSKLDSLSGKLDLNLRDCGLLIKSGVLGDISIAYTTTIPNCSSSQTEPIIKELFARLQIGDLEAKKKALDSLVEIIKEDQKSVFNVLGRSNISALVQLLTVSTPGIREHSASIVSTISESGCFEKFLVSENVISPLIRLIESGNALCKEKAIVSLQKLSTSAETSRLIIEHKGAPSLIELCKNSDSILQASAVCTLKNLSAVPDLRKSLVDEEIIKVMINILDHGMLLKSKEYSSECLQNLSFGNENIRRLIISEGGIKSLLSYIDSPFPQEPAMGALKNLIGSVSIDDLVSSGLIPRLVHVLRSGSLGAQVLATSAILQVCNTVEMKKLLGEAGCVSLIIKLLEAKRSDAREAASQVLLSLMEASSNKREVKKDDKSVPNIVQLLDPSPQNSAKKYAILCLLNLSTSKKCRKMMISYGAIGYLKKLSEMEIVGAKKLLGRLEKRKLRSFFSIK